MIRTFMCTVAGASIAVFALISAADAQSTAAKPLPKCKTVKVETDCGARTDCVWIKSYVKKKTGKEVPAMCRSKASKRAVKRAAKAAKAAT